MVDNHGTFWKILVPLDGSDYSTKALRYAVSIGKKYGSKLMLVHIVISPLYAYAEGFVMTDHERRLEDEGSNILKKGLEYAKSEGVEAESFLKKGHPSEEISNIANEEKYDLIVMGSRGLSGIKIFLLGSVSERVSRFAKCPVMIVKLSGHMGDSS